MRLIQVTAADAKLQALVILGRRIGKVPWCIDIGTRSAASVLLQLYGITIWEKRKEALERTRSKEKEE